MGAIRGSKRASTADRRGLALALPGAMLDKTTIVRAVVLGLGFVACDEAQIEPEAEAAAEEVEFRALPPLREDDFNVTLLPTLPGTCKLGKTLVQTHKFDHIHCIDGISNTCTHTEHITNTCTHANPAVWHASAPSWVSTACAASQIACSGYETVCGTKAHWCSDWWDGEHCGDVSVADVCDGETIGGSATSGQTPECVPANCDELCEGDGCSWECPIDPAEQWHQLRGCISWL